MREPTDDPPGEAELLRAVARGDQAAFAQLYDLTAPWLTARLRRRCRDDDLVAEVLQDTFLAVWRTAGGFAGRGEAVGWLWTIAAHRMVDAFRRRAARGQLTAQLDQLTHDLTEQQPGPAAPSAEEQALAEVLDAGLATALERLSPELRAVLRATVLDGLSTREAALLLGVPEGTVKTRAMRARRQLREALA